MRHRAMFVTLYIYAKAIAAARHDVADVADDA